MAVAAETRGTWIAAPFALLGDERLARLAAAGHGRAFAVVYERHHQALYRYCRSILRDDADAQDAVQSTFASAFAALARGQRDAPIRPWLFRIAHNEAVSLLRRRRPTAELSEVTNAVTASVEEEVAERDELSLLLHDLGKLTERQRSALVMRELSGLSHEEIALALGTSVGAAKQTIYEARRSLFEFAEGRAMTCDDIRRTISDADGRALRSRRVRAHLRQCVQCSAFAAAIPVRRSDLRALAPALPTVAALGLLEQICAAGSGHGAAGVTTAAVGKATGAALTANGLAGVAVVASATVGVTIGVGHLVQTDRHPAHRPAVAPAVASARSRVSPASPAVLGGRSLAPEQSSHAASRPTQHPHAGSSTTATRGAAPRSRPGPGRSPQSSTAGGAGSSAGRGSREHGAGRAGAAPGQAKTPPGQAGTPPGQARTPPGQAKTLSGQAGTPPGQARMAPGQAKTRSGQASTSRGQTGSRSGRSKAPTGHSRTSPRRAGTRSAQADITPGQAVISTDQAKASASTAALVARAPAPASPPSATIGVGGPPATPSGANLLTSHKLK